MSTAKSVLALLSVACAATLLALPASAATGAVAPPDQTGASYGAGWLGREISAGGGHLESFGAADLGDTAYAVLGLHAAGVGRVQSAQAIAYLKQNLGAPLQEPDGTDDPGLLGYVIMAAVSAGDDPSHFGGRKPVNDLTARLLATARTSGPDTGLFGSADPTYDGAFRQGVALAALKAAGVPAATVQTSLTWLTTQQCGNGLWTSYRSDPSVRCPAANPNTFTGPDTNSTGMAAQGLAAYGQHPRRARLVASLAKVRSSDGGFPYIAAKGQPSDPDSTALSIQALLADGADPGGAYQALASYQLGCADPTDDRGAYFYPGSRSPSVLATVQAVPAAAGLTLPLPPSTLSASLPAPVCTTSTGRPPARAGAQPGTQPGSQAGTPGACAKNAGVTVTVDFTAFGGVEQTRCAVGAQTSGLTAMENAGFTPTGTAQYGLAFVCRIQGLPAPAQQSCTRTPPADAYWAYYHAVAGAKGWTASTVGASSYQPPLGSIEAWAFGDGATPTKSPAHVRKSTR